ncbi:hypothetical protein phi16_gp051 [Corynebacterium phage phi16]|uniref:hypothetical protein n=1 Tax=Corynebacterium glutamicum TaxID=1718 RepID=UPI00094482D8|nr:hypothetical protein [Corynebacterium glutamicum]APQ42554.1 hypothetical protein phi16_gp051 [Corynebacterium phage phi16]OKX80541.1 hypothetical protein AUO95_10370 [Corynebacterium glutamicum]
MDGSDYDRPLDPVEVERRIRITADRIEDGVGKVKRANISAKDSERLYRLEKARIKDFYRGQGLSHADAETKATLETAEYLEERDHNQAAYEYARDYLYGLKDMLSSLQTQAKGLSAAYPMAGRGL